MSSRDIIEVEKTQVAEVESGSDLLRPLMKAGPVKAPQSIPQAGIVVGELIGMTNEGRTPLVRYPGQTGTVALLARTMVDLHGPHIGRQVALMFEGADPSRPIIMGVLQEGEGWPRDQKPEQVEVDVDGERMLVTAKEQLVLRCGKASITLTKAGKVMIKGSYVLSRSSGVNRIKGGSVQLN
ncbi:hypothetical protein C8R32_10447 [Nitrosospira sp. Nsp5]|uniref:DUF6484 domain-containing protein n=1 Tax=Nitrosospira multiformis TaxID=1231 RepID=A0ABY0TIX4_9PROT|nr:MULTISPECIES: DUF6484 domain-containing protein [Nitrosospira]PTR08968.1 hypothetical protein C8R32_10447 [Nitrosospira sp. Nsp5]SDQ68027.1 hypothetical protein SAMN05216402_1826 [Nitrosospira multiformis]